ADVLVLTRGDVGAVKAVGETPIRTESNAALPTGLRAAALEAPGYRIANRPFLAGDPWSPCPRVTALSATGDPINERGRSSVPLVFRLPMRHWEEPERPPSGA